MCIFRHFQRFSENVYKGLESDFEPLFHGLLKAEKRFRPAELFAFGQKSRPDVTFFSGRLQICETIL